MAFLKGESILIFSDRQWFAKNVADSAVFLFLWFTLTSVSFLYLFLNGEKDIMLFPLYLKESYIRNSPVDIPEKIPVNLGLEIKGYEYR